MWLNDLRKLGGNVIRGTQILYVPSHANGSLTHPDCESGFVTSVKDDGLVFCRYWSKHEDYELRTKANSEGTHPTNIFVVDTVPQRRVIEMLDKYC